MTKIIGITGGIASGKSTVTNYIKVKKIPIHDSDNVVFSLYNKPTKKFLKFLKKIKLGAAIKKNTISKNIIRENIFKDINKKNMLEKFIHNEVRKSRNKFFKKNINKKNKLIFLDIPLLFEKNLDKICDFVFYMYAPLKVRKKRALNRKGMNRQILNLIIKNQIKDSEKKRKSDYVINTTKSKKMPGLRPTIFILFFCGAF